MVVSASYYSLFTWGFCYFTSFHQHVHVVMSGCCGVVAQACTSVCWPSVLCPLCAGLHGWLRDLLFSGCGSVPEPTWPSTTWPSTTPPHLVWRITMETPHLCTTGRPQTLTLTWTETRSFTNWTDLQDFTEKRSSLTHLQHFISKLFIYFSTTADHWYDSALSVSLVFQVNIPSKQTCIKNSLFSLQDWTKTLWIYF